MSLKQTKIEFGCFSFSHKSFNSSGYSFSYGCNILAYLVGSALWDSSDLPAHSVNILELYVSSLMLPNSNDSISSQSSPPYMYNHNFMIWANYTTLTRIKFSPSGPFLCSFVTQTMFIAQCNSMLLPHR